MILFVYFYMFFFVFLIALIFGGVSEFLLTWKKGDSFK